MFISRAIASLLLVSAAGAALAQPPAQAPGSIRVRVTTVPVDVRVVDRQGNPVKDLKQEDFTILEDGVPQDIRYFSTQSLTADPAAEAGARASAPLPRRAPGSEIAADNKRVFLVMLGRGRHQAVAGGVEALTAFVRERLLPQDRIALMAWNRATDFTTNHDLLARTVVRYGERAEAIETDLRMWFSGLRAVYGSKTIPPHIQKQIDAVFEESRSLRPRELTPGQVSNARRLDDDTRRITDDLMTQKIAGDRPGGSALMPDKNAENTAAIVGLDFDDYVAQTSEIFQDLGSLYAGIEYLRYLDGEKHLVLFTESGLRLPRREDNISIANAASDARIAVETIHTGGIAGPPPPRFDGRGGLVMQPLPTAGARFGEGFAVQDLQTISEQTGGRSSAFKKGSDALDRLDRSTRFQYLLGYTPADVTRDRKFRKLTVKVNRPGLTVMYRHGYYATDQLVPLDRRQFLTFGRVYQAGRYAGKIDDIKFTLKPPAIVGSKEAAELVLELQVDLSRIAFVHKDDRSTATIDLAVFFGDAKGNLVGEAWRIVNMTMTDANRDRTLREGGPVKAIVPLPANARDVKIVLYDYGSDLLGTAAAKLK